MKKTIGFSERTFTGIGALPNTATSEESTVYPYSPAQVFDMVADVRSYPQFLPMWKSVSIEEASTSHIRATQEIGWARLAFTLHSDVSLDKPNQIVVNARGGPFRQLIIKWRFTPRSGNHCLVQLSVNADLEVGPQQFLIAQFVKNSLFSILERFRSRAGKIYSLSSFHH